jgi:hypothetical protein
MDDPAFNAARTLHDEPKCAKLNTDRTDPILAKHRNDNEEHMR